MAMTPRRDEVQSQARYRMSLARGAAVAACALLAAACGSTVAPTTGAPTAGAQATGVAGSNSAASGSASTASAAKVSLDVTFAASASRPATHYTLRCEPAGGTTPDPAAACSRLLADASLFASRPRHVMCPMIMASARRARVTGTYLGKTVRETIVDGGCDLARWAELKAVFS
jgi:hypothetical protein